MNKEAFSLEAVSAAASADTLRLLTCGSVDDGKSTLIGRLLFDSHLLMEDQVAELERDSKKHGTAGDEIDFALLVDGLEAEPREEWWHEVIQDIRRPATPLGSGEIAA